LWSCVPPNHHGFGISPYHHGILFVLVIMVLCSSLSSWSCHSSLLPWSFVLHDRHALMFLSVIVVLSFLLVVLILCSFCSPWSCVPMFMIVLCSSWSSWSSIPFSHCDFVVSLVFVVLLFLLIVEVFCFS